MLGTQVFGRRAAVVLTLTLAWASDRVDADSVTGYHIGNSLTNTSLYNGWLGGHAQSRGHTLSVGYHIRASQSLSYIWANPADVTYASPSTFDTALSGQEWDYVTLQPYHQENQTEARSAIGNMIALTRTNAANSNTRFYVYSAWPQELGGTDYSTRWLETYDGSGSRTWTRDFFNGLMEAVRADHMDLPSPIYMIPVGEVLYELDQLAEAGKLPGYAGIEELYEDPYHLTPPVGHYIASVVTYCTIFGDTAIGLPKPNGISDELAAIIQQTSWDVIRTHQYTGVPEPSTTGMAALSLLGLLARRRRGPLPDRSS